MFHSRGPNKIKNPYTLKHMYKEYIADKEEGTPYYVDYSTFVNIITDYYKSLSEYILDGGMYQLPYRLGELSVIGKRPKTLSKKTLKPDWGEFNKTGTYALHFNDHTDYKKYMFRWSKIKGYVKNMKSYRLVMTRDNKRELARRLKEGGYDYFEI